MRVSSSGIQDNGYFADRFGKFGDQKNHFDKVTYSIPFEIEGAPKETVSYAFFMEDKDAIPVSGFSWIHWVGANLKRTKIEENESISATDFVQGLNSWISPLAGSQSIKDSSVYGGMAPPNADHLYELHVYALDTELDLKPGFHANELFHAMKGHVLASATVEGWYRFK